MVEYAVQVGDSDPQALTAALNAMAGNGFELDFIYDRLGEPPLLVYSRELDDAMQAVE
jgi:hypothetical protein